VPVGGGRAGAVRGSSDCSAPPRETCRLGGKSKVQQRGKTVETNDCTNSSCVCACLFPSLQRAATWCMQRGGAGTERELTLVPIRRLVREQWLAAGVAGEAAILDAESVELGELLPEHSAHAARGGPNGGECIRARGAQELEIPPLTALDYATAHICLSPFQPRPARALLRQHCCCRPGRHARPDKQRHAAASNKPSRGCACLHSPALQDISDCEHIQAAA
jgi:hypothetical protein